MGDHHVRRAHITPPRILYELKAATKQPFPLFYPRRTTQPSVSGRFSMISKMIYFPQTKLVIFYGHGKPAMSRCGSVGVAIPQRFWRRLFGGSPMSRLSGQCSCTMTSTFRAGVIPNDPTWVCPRGVWSNHPVMTNRACHGIL